MPSDAGLPAPGDMTVPPWAGWEEVLTGVLLLTSVAVALVLAALTWRGAGERTEWQAWLDARPRRDPDPADPGSRTVAPGPRSAPDRP